jgi:DNA-binding NtrC family response regulator
MALEINILMYSAKRNKPNFIELNSVWYPPTNSDSLSGKSKGARLHSAKAQTKKIKKPTG